MAETKKETVLGHDTLNDDLLLYAESQAWAQNRHPHVYPLLVDEELLGQFAERDGLATRNKRVSRAVGFWAVIMALLSLFTTAAEPLWGHTTSPWHLPRVWSTTLGLIGALLGVASVLIAFCGVIHGARKTDWLRDRLITERLRQFHFQTFVFHLDKILDYVTASRNGAPTDAAFHAFQEEHHACWDDLERTISEWNEKSTADLTRLFESLTNFNSYRGPTTWLHGDVNNQRKPTLPESARLAATEDLNCVFSAYLDLRIQKQINHVEYTLRHRNHPGPSVDARTRMPLREWFPGRTLPIRQWHDMLRQFWQANIILLLSLHAFMIATVFVPSLPGPEENSSLLHVSALCLALVAVAARSLKEGFAITGDIERYEAYLADCCELRRQFTAENTSIDERFAIMVQMEQLAFEEMRDFIRSHLEATFVM